MVTRGTVAVPDGGLYDRRMFRRHRKIGQTTTEYMLVVSVISIGALAMLAYFGDPDSPPQKAADELSQNFQEGLTNTGGKMEVLP